MEVQLADRDDVVCLGERGVDVSPRPRAAVGHVAAAPLVEHRGVRLQRLAGVDDDVERLVVDPHELGRVACELARLGDHRDDGLAEVAHLADREGVVLDAGSRLGCDLEEGVGLQRDLVARQRPVDAGQLERSGDVDRRDARMGVRRAHEVQVAHPVALDVVEERPLALDEAPVLLARDALADEPLLEGGAVGLDGGHAAPFPAATTASTMFQYPVQRQMLPWSAALTSSAVGRRRGLEQRRGAHQHARCAVAALQRMVGVEGLLQRGERVAVGEALDRGDGRAVGLHGEHGAALHGDAVEVHGARAAAPGVAPDVRARQIEVVAQEVHEQAARGHLALDGLPVHGDRDDLAGHW